MVDITRCENCGKVIPALGRGCPYCDPDDAVRIEKPYLPLAIRLLLGLFVFDLAVTMVIALLTLFENQDGGLLASILIVISLMRFLLAGVTVVALYFREWWSRLSPLAFLAFEAIIGVSVLFGWIPADRWVGGMLAPLWSVLFVFLFLREDVQAYLDPSVGDRRELGRLLREVERGRNRTP